MPAHPIAYFLTFRTYGTWLPGDKRGFVNNKPSPRGNKTREPVPKLEAYSKAIVRGEPFVFTAEQQTVVELAIRDACEYKGWELHALNVRLNHVHAVVTSEKSPELTMRHLKARATRLLHERELVNDETKVWARHGSTIRCYKQAQLEHTIRYTIEEQDGARFGVGE